jgi:hypothetical protein
MQFENVTVVRARRGSFDERPSGRLLDGDPTNRKAPPRPPVDVDSSWDLLATALSSVMGHVVMAFAIAAAGMYPALLWMLIDGENRRDAAEVPPGRGAEEPPRRGGSGGSDGASDPRRRRLVRSVGSGAAQRTDYPRRGLVSHALGALGEIMRSLLFTAASLLVVTRITRAAGPEIIGSARDGNVERRLEAGPR